VLLAERARVRARVPRASGPALVLGVGALAVALFAAITGLQVTVHALDETVYKFAAVQQANDLPFGALHEHTSRGVARLYSFLVAPLFEVFAGDVGVRLARALNSVFFAATAIPVALLARRVTVSPWSACAAGLLSVAVPWLTLATIMFSESLAYLLFACAVLAMVRAVEAPGWRREVLVIGLIVALVLTRVQFLALAPAWVLVVAIVARRSARERFPITTAAVALAVVGALGLLAFGLLSGGLRDLAGPYYDIVRRDGVPGNFGLALLWEVEMLSLGVGLLPAVLAAAWFARALSRRDGFDGAFATIVLTVVAVLFATTLWAQGGFLDFRSEERYFIYAVPFLWIGAVAAVERRDLPRGWVAAAGAGLVLVLLSVPVTSNGTGEQAFLGPVSLSASHRLPILERGLGDALGLGGAVTGRDLLGLLCVLVVALAVVLWRRGGRARAAALVPAVVLQLLIAGYAFSGVHGKLEGIGGLTFDVAFADLGWVDRATPGDPQLKLLDNQSEGREGAQRDTIFWNDEVVSVYSVAPAGVARPGFPVFTLPSTGANADPELRLDVPLDQRAVTAVDSPLWQMAAETERLSPDGTLALVRPARPARLQWLTEGLETDGHVVRDLAVRVAGGHRVTVEAVTPTDNGQAAGIRVELGGRKRELTFGGEQPGEASVAIDLCGAGGIVTGRVALLNAADIGGNRFSGARLRRVRLERC
jgi:hypothetical protein